MKDAPKLQVDYRLAARATLGDARGPTLRAVVKDGRTAVLYSPLDLSVGLVGTKVAGVVGYTPETATALVARTVRVAAER